MVLRSAAEGAVSADWPAAVVHAAPRLTPEPSLRAVVRKFLLIGALESLKSTATVTPDELANAIWLETSSTKLVGRVIDGRTEYFI